MSVQDLGASSDFQTTFYLYEKMTENVMQFRPKQTVNAILANLIVDENRLETAVTETRNQDEQNPANLCRA